MVTSFPSPVLSVAVDVVRDLDGKEALSGLWNLFTKCKGSLQDGYRLENISWRLWHRELAAAAALAEPSRQLRRPSTPDDCFPSINTAPLSPVSEFGNQRDSQVVKVGQDLERPLRTPSPVPSTHSGISSGASSTRPPSVRSRSATSVGQIIVDMIPNNSIDASMQNCPVSEPVKHEPELELAASSLPSPVAEPVIAPFPTVILPAPSSQSSLGTPAVFPRVVIVNPTPHPTPPATPVPSQPPHTGGSHSSASVHLLPPPRASVALVNGHAKRAHATAPAPRLTVSNLASEATARPSKSDNVPHSRQRRSRPTSPVPEHDRDACQISERDLSVEERSAVLDRDSPSSESHTERRSPARSPSTSSNRSPSVSGANASSLASNQSTQTHASSVRRRQYAAHHPHRARFGQRAHPLVQRKAAGSEAQHKAGHAAFDVGSVTSDGSKATSGSQRRPSTGSTDTRISPVPHPAPMLTESPRPLQPIASPSRNAKTTSGPPLPGPAKPRANSDGPVVEKRPGLDPRSDLRAAQLREQPPRPQPPPPQPPKQAVNERRNVVLAPSDDEYETTESDISAGESSEWEDDEDEEEEDAVATEKQNRLREAALEAQRQRELFDKLPKRSYSNVPRTQSGLLSQLMNPDPNLFPPGHPVRTASSADVGRMPMPMPPRPLVPQRAPPMPALATSQSTTALPQLSAVTAQTQAQPPSNHYRPRGRPEGEELEDESSDEEGGDGDTSGGISRSLAQQRLAALADPNRRRSSQPSAVPQLQHSLQPAPDRPSLASVATAPIPLNHPWNLPPPAPPMTPRATRRQMLSTELSESLRRNLLWERQVSKTNLLRGGLRPLTQTRSEQPAPREEPREETEEQRREREHAERRRAALARNRSWADDYHYAGW